MCADALSMHMLGAWMCAKCHSRDVRGRRQGAWCCGDGSSDGAPLCLVMSTCMACIVSLLWCAGQRHRKDAVQLRTVLGLSCSLFVGLSATGQVAVQLLQLFRVACWHGRLYCCIML